MQKIVPFLWFDDQAEEAANLYVSVFKNSKTSSVRRYGNDIQAPVLAVPTRTEQKIEHTY